ncbi:MAG: STAS domain-containing protein [Bacteroidota bacterium]
MEFKIKHEKGVTIISLKGEVIGGPDATELRRQLHSLIDQGQKKIVIDLGQVELMNSSGLGMLIGGLTTVRNAGGDLRLAKASTKILSLFTVTKLSKVFTHYDSVKSAIDSYQ